jgi:hypothetical protein
MKFEDRHLLNKPAATVIKMYGDQKFFERKYKDIGAWDIVVLECDKSDKKFRIKCRYSIKSSNPNIPAFATKFVGDSSTITQTDTWDLIAKTGRLDVEIKGVPVKVGADMVLIGGKLEQLIVDDIKSKSAQDVAVTVKILADY